MPPTAYPISSGRIPATVEFINVMKIRPAEKAKHKAVDLSSMFASIIPMCLRK